MSEVVTGIAINEKTSKLHLVGGSDQRALCGPTWQHTAEALDGSMVHLDRHHLCGLCRRVLLSNADTCAAVLGHVVDGLLEGESGRRIDYWLDVFQEELDRRRPDRR